MDEMFDDLGASPLSEAEEQLFLERLARDEKFKLSPAEREYLILETIRAKRNTKDLLLEHVMVINQYSKEKRAADEMGLGSASPARLLPLLDALDAAVEETAVFITNMDEGPDSFPSHKQVIEYAAARESDTLVLDEYHAFHLIKNFFVNLGTNG